MAFLLLSPISLLRCPNFSSYYCSILSLSLLLFYRLHCTISFSLNVFFKSRQLTRFRYFPRSSSLLFIKIFHLNYSLFLYFSFSFFFLVLYFIVYLSLISPYFYHLLSYFLCVLLQLYYFALSSFSALYCVISLYSPSIVVKILFFIFLIFLLLFFFHTL